MGDGWLLQQLFVCCLLDFHSLQTLLMSKRRSVSRVDHARFGGGAARMVAILLDAGGYST